MEEKLLVTSRELIMVALICTAALSGVRGLVKKEDIESSLSIIHEVSSQSLGSLCVTEQFRSLTVPIDTLRFESARQKADLAATLLQDLGVAHHNGLQDAISKNILVSDPSVLSARVLAMNATTGALLNCAWWQKQGLEMGGPKKVAETIMEVGHRPSTDYPWYEDADSSPGLRSPKFIESPPNISYRGWWTYPYYSCSARRWLMSYSVPIPPPGRRGMPTKYKRTGSCSRASWTEQQLAEAIQAVNENRMGVNEAARNFGVPATTLRRRKLRDNVKKGPLGPSSTLGEAAEEKLAKHILKLQKNGFSPTRTDVRSMAFKLAEQLGIKHNFNKELRLAGFPWLQLFLQRNPRLSVRKAEGVSINRSLGMNKKDVEAYFQLLENTLIENSLMNKPGHIYNMDETGLQLNNRPGHVIVKKGSKNIASISSGEKGETITVIACCNAEGVFLPPTCVMKGKNKKKEFEDGMPPGSLVYMSERSAYVNSDIFFQWLKDQFVPKKPTGAVLLLLDGHASHCNNVEMLEYCVEHNIILLCLPSHTTQFLQPLDRCFFRSLKLNYYSACNLYIQNNPGRKLTRLQFGKLLAEGWNKSATVHNGTSAFKATGIMPFNPSAIPDDAYLTENNIVLEAPVAGKNKQIPDGSSQSLNKVLSDDDQQPCCSWQTEDEEKQNESVAETNANTPVKSTPGKMLEIISPVPIVSAEVNSVRKRSKQLAEILTTETTIGEKRTKRLEKIEKERKVKTSKLKPVLKKPKVTKKKTRKAAKSDSSSDEDLEAPTLDDSSDDMDDDDQTCTGCGEIYSQTTKSDDWVNCIRCSKWFHDSCSKFVNFCHDCVVICKTK